MNKIQHPSNNSVLGAPKGMSIEDCVALPITRIQYADGTLAVSSYWQPTEVELALLRQGKSVRITILGITHSPIILGVDGDGVL